MLENTLSALLHSVASRYAKLSPSDVGIGLRGGRLVVEDVQLRADTFNKLQIPFHVHEGRAGRLRVNVPWSALTSAPVEVYLENIYLIAGPALHDPSTQSKAPPQPTKPEWHQTIVGRLLFNVSVEMYGLKIEYRDDHCISIMSVASLVAFSAGPDWQRRFVSLASDLDRNSPHSTAVTMRKFVSFSGAHWLMIPRTKDASNSAQQASSDHHLKSPRYQERHMDLESYESHAPILDGIPISAKVLLRSGTVLLNNIVTPGLHCEVHVDIEEPSINLTARQIKWIDFIVKAALGIADYPTHNLTNSHQTTSSNSRSTSQTSQIMHAKSAPALHVSSEQQTIHSDPHRPALISDDASIDSRIEKELANSLQASNTTTQDHSSQNVHNHYSEDDDAEEDNLIIVREDSFSEGADSHVEQPRKGGFRSFWHAIVAENTDETVDDAAIALGLSNGRVVEEEEVDEIQEREEEDQSEHQSAREAVFAAARAGGLTMRLFVKTPDTEARDKIEQLEEELEEERKIRTRLEHTQSLFLQSEQRIQDAEALAQKLKDRNGALVQELQDLEKMTSHSGKNKDAMIRQIEAALFKAERNLQSIIEANMGKQSSTFVSDASPKRTRKSNSVPMSASSDTPPPPPPTNPPPPPTNPPPTNPPPTNLPPTNLALTTPTPITPTPVTSTLPSPAFSTINNVATSSTEKNVAVRVQAQVSLGSEKQGVRALKAHKEGEDLQQFKEGTELRQPAKQDAQGIKKEVKPLEAKEGSGYGNESGVKYKDGRLVNHEHSIGANTDKPAKKGNEMLKTSVSGANDALNRKEQSTHNINAITSGSGLVDVELYRNKYDSIPTFNAPSISVKKLISDMSSNVNVTDAMSGKHLEAAISSEGLTLI